jgi:hypothetical protein
MLRALGVDHTLFVGDFANENEEFVRLLKDSMHPLHFSAILGNHDAWASTVDTVAGTIPKVQR